MRRDCEAHWSSAGALLAEHRWARNALIGLATASVILCPIFLMAATSIEGVLERVLGLIACAMVWTLCAVFYQRGRHPDYYRQQTSLPSALP